MKKTLFILSLLLTFTLSQSGIMAGAVTGSAQQSNVNPATIETSATSQIEAAPDIAYINASINIVDESRTVASSTNKKATDNMIDAAVKAGVAKVDIKTVSFYANAYIDRIVENPNDPKPIYKDVKKYQVTSNFKIKVKDLAKVSDVLGSLLDVDNVNIGNVNYDVSNLQSYKNQAIQKAVADAKDNIVFAAAAAGVKVNKLQSMSVDFSNNSYNPYPVYANAMVAKDSSSVYQNPDNIKVSASVHLVYTVK